MSKRYDILEAFHAVVAANPPAGEVKWRKDSKSPILRPSVQECPSFYVFDFQEQVIEEAKQKNDLCRAKLFIMLEIFVVHTLSDEPSEVLNNALAPLQQALQGNTLGGLAQKVSEVGSKFKVESQEQRMVSAEVAFYATYFRRNGE